MQLNTLQFNDITHRKLRETHNFYITLSSVNPMSNFSLILSNHIRNYPFQDA